MRFRTSLLAAVGVIIPAAAWAQADPMLLARLAAANQAGLMQYCLGHGWVDQAAVDAQTKSAAAIPPDPSATGLGAAEASGRQGIVAANGNSSMPLARMAAQTNTTEQALCGKFGESAKSAATQQAAMPAMPGGMPAVAPAAMQAPGGLPQIPGGMPQMPAGMPQVPGGLPGAAPQMPAGMTQMPAIPK